MTDSRWQRVEQLFHEARALPKDQRTSYLSQVCAGDDVMLNAVLRLIDATSAADALFENPSALASLIERTSPLPPISGQSVPCLASGALTRLWPPAGWAMSTWPIAPTTSSTKRPPPSSSDVDSNRNISGGGFWRSGRSWPAWNIQHRPASGRQSFSGRHAVPDHDREFVEGQPLDAYCNSRNLGIRAHLGVFRHVCAAVSYAHHNMVIHRDLKPSNVMVATSGDVKLLNSASPRLVDEPDDGELTSTTAVMMTPRYASPEQALGKLVNAPIRRLLPGRHALRVALRPQPLQHHPANRSRVVCGNPERGVPPASQAVQSPALRKELSGDLDLIVAKALCKDPQERYASVEQFDADLQSFLEGRPILARPQTATYRLGKLLSADTEWGCFQHHRRPAAHRRPHHDSLGSPHCDGGAAASGEAVCPGEGPRPVESLRSL
ncbi:MAG: protein kinase [Paludibaculum sp.]